MNFIKEANNLIKMFEAKDEKPGQRFTSVQNAQGPAGVTSSPVGRADFNPVKPENKSKGPGPKASTSIKKAENAIRNCFRILKTNPKFRAMIPSIVASYSAKRRQISAAQEKVLRNYPGTISKLQGELTRKEQIVASLGDDPRAAEYVDEIKDLSDRLYGKYIPGLDEVYDEIRDVVSENEEISVQFQDKLVDQVVKTTDEVLEDMLKKDEELKTIAYTSFDQLPDDIYSDESLTQDAIRVQLLNMLLSEDETVNPLYAFFSLANQRYLDSKDSIFKKNSSGKYNISVESLYNRLPISQFTFFFNAIKDDAPLKPLAGSRKLLARKSSEILQMLDIRTQNEFDEIKDDLADKINALKIDPERKVAALQVINGPFIQKGTPVTLKLKGMLGGVLRDLAKESFDEIYRNTLTKYRHGTV